MTSYHLALVMHSPDEHASVARDARSSYFSGVSRFQPTKTRSGQPRSISRHEGGGKLRFELSTAQSRSSSFPWSPSILKILDSQHDNQTTFNAANHFTVVGSRYGIYRPVERRTLCPLFLQPQYFEQPLGRAARLDSAARLLCGVWHRRCWSARESPSNPSLPSIQFFVCICEMLYSEQPLQGRPRFCLWIMISPRNVDVDLVINKNIKADCARLKGLNDYCAMSSSMHVRKADGHHSTCMEMSKKQSCHLQVSNLLKVTC